ncbi:MAG TPA: T9SS type A sorting domain-containing protein, partial [Chitinophagales bacterium]|nr:T9SS type A sorting domain-containing protein [Chitinophagales bacterium]
AAHILLRKSANDIGYSEEMWKFFRPHTISTGVNEITSNSKVETYPIPAKDIVNIQLQSIPNYQKLQVSVFDFMGKQIAQLFGNNSGSYSLDCSNLSNGVYLIKATNGSNSYSSKFTVKR